MIFKKKIIKYIALAHFFIANTVLAQDLLYQNSNIGFNIGANLAIGTHFQRLGLNFNFFYTNNFFQSNSEIRTYFSFKNLGPKKIYNEIVLSQGLLFGYGAKQNFYNPFINSVSNQTIYKNAIAYSYNFYINYINTKQVTGIAAFQVDAITLVLENDILAKPTLDRFRTGAFLIQYQYKDIFQAAINCTMWTGQMGKIVDLNNSTIYSNCYMDTTGGKFTNISHGLLSAQFKYNLAWGQNLQANIGVDAEKVRNAVQNKFIHDARFIPKKLKKRKICHIPMLDENNNQYLYLPNQKVKPTKLFWNIFSNANLFY